MASTPRNVLAATWRSDTIVYTKVPNPTTKIHLPDDMGTQIADIGGRVARLGAGGARGAQRRTVRDGSFNFNHDSVAGLSSGGGVKMNVRNSRSGHVPGGGTTCTDGQQNGDETGTDCGGSCSACALARFE